jgi:pimeloyl-ACP methyl ester carboxylesterase
MTSAQVKKTEQSLDGLDQPVSIYDPSFPYRPKFLEITSHRLAYFDEGAGPKTILMVHGNPVSGYVYVPLMRHLLPDYRCVVPDLLGFGMSDKPAEEEAYSLSGHIAMIAEFIERLDLHDLAIIGHDWGGPISFGAAIQNPDRFTQLIILNTMTETPVKILPHYWLPFHILLRTRRLFSYLVRDQGLFQRLGVAIMDSHDQAVYARANHDWATRAGIAAFPHMIPNNPGHPNYPILKEILSKLESWDIPALVLFSNYDSVFTAEQGERFAKRMVNARFELIDGPKHFLQYEQPDLIGRLIRDFLEEK